ncbi:hypothetical protein LIA77_08317 [Sarocladium implicatum]|nr:hypothetical protein LIA77_08317 [Sarocladium implicatum]
MLLQMTTAVSVQGGLMDLCMRRESDALSESLTFGAVLNHEMTLQRTRRRQQQEPVQALSATEMPDSLDNMARGRASNWIRLRRPAWRRRRRSGGGGGGGRDRREV